MSNISENDRIDDVAPGDIVTVERGAAGPQPCKVVHKETVDGAYLVTFEVPGEDTFQLQYPAGTRVTRSLEAKWESEQSPTPRQ
jgi:hypothetical protein